MRKFRKSICLSLLIACLMFVTGIFTACNSDKIKLTAENDATTLKPGQSIQLLVDNKEPENYTFNITEGENLATVSNDGVLTMKATATPGETVKIVAKKSSVTSNTLTITVGSINLTALSATASASEVLRNNSYTLTYTATPQNTTETISWHFIEGSNLAEIVGNRLIINSNATYGGTIKVKAQGETISSNVLEFTVVQYSSEGLFLSGDDSVELLDAAQANHTYTIEVLNAGGQKVDNKGSELNFDFINSSDEELVEVTQSGYNFVLKAIGHGTATLRITLGELYHDVEINCVKAPDAIYLPEVLQTKNNIEFKTAKDAVIENFNFIIDGENVCEDLLYTFETLDGSNWVDNANAGTYANGALTLKTEGKVKVTATSNSGSVFEKSASFIFDVNDGINVSTFEEFHDQVKASTGRAINIVNMSLTDNKLVPSFITANQQTAENINSKLSMDVTSGKLLLNGNGYEIDLSNLRCLNKNEAQENIGSFIEIKGAAATGNTEADHIVKIYDLTITGNVLIDDTASTTDDGVDGKFFRAIDIGSNGEEVSYLVDINNIKISKFGVGIRVAHAVSPNAENISKISNITVQNIWSNGLETAASQIVLDTLNIGLCGGLGMEVTPDNFGDAGLTFDQNQDVKFIGNWIVENSNNGQTPYFDSLNFNGLTVPILIKSSLVSASDDKISNIRKYTGDPEAQEKLDEDYVINMIALKFNEFDKGLINGSTISQGVFSNSIINFNDITGIDTTHKYIELDLVYQSIPVGKIIVYNWNYQG